MKTQYLKKMTKKLVADQFIDYLYPIVYRHKKMKTAHTYQDLVKNKIGLEIGGPSSFFKYVMPLYPLVKKLDGVNFSKLTVWEGDICEGFNFRFYKNRVGFQYITEAVDLSQIESDCYDFVLSCNCLEHIANPLQALCEWKRVLLPGGYMILVLPDKIYNFDHNRPTTTFEHLLDDYNSHILESDLTHINEILALHDLSMDPQAGDIFKFKKRSLENYFNRCLHHHVFDIALLEKMLTFFHIDLVSSDQACENIIVSCKVNK
jgi:SAM-dependent methyltransferase